jgi:hypothetical protein
MGLKHVAPNGTATEPTELAHCFPRLIIIVIAAQGPRKEFLKFAAAHIRSLFLWLQTPRQFISATIDPKIFAQARNERPAGGLP